MKVRASSFLCENFVEKDINWKNFENILTSKLSSLQKILFLFSFIHISNETREGYSDNAVYVCMIRKKWIWIIWIKIGMA